MEKIKFLASTSAAHLIRLKASKLLAEKAAHLGLQVIVNAFHGWAHNRLCQLKYHPLYRRGLGLEDLETLERVFLSSNSIACTILHTTQFHWSQYVDFHFQQWDADKYQELGKSTYHAICSVLIYVKQELLFWITINKHWKSSKTLSLNLRHSRPAFRWPTSTLRTGSH